VLQIDGRPIGPGHPSYIVAEIGINHNGDLDLARKSIDAAKAAGADAVKFQNYRTEDFLSDRKLTYTYVSQGKSVTEAQFDMFKRCELSRDHLRQLADHCRAIGIAMHSTPTGQDGIDDLLAAGVGVLKNGSDYLTNLDLVAAFARTGLPTVLSTGMATVAEIDDAVRTYRAAGGQDLILLHCTSSYPTPPDQINLTRIPVLRDSFGCLVGFSDHSAGTIAAVASIAFGACWIEKHFTFDRTLPGPDHHFSSDPAEFRQLVDSVRFAEAALGTPTLGPTANEEKGRLDFRLSCVAARSLPAGTELSIADIAFRRPGNGVRPAERGLLLGRRLKSAVEIGHLFTGSDFA